LVSTSYTIDDKKYKERHMNFLNMLANDPVVMFAFGGIAITVGICAFYVYYFIKHINEDTK
jgi:hypothetical protein